MRTHRGGFLCLDEEEITLEYLPLSIKRTDKYKGKRLTIEEFAYSLDIHKDEYGKKIPTKKTGEMIHRSYGTYGNWIYTKKKKYLISYTIWDGVYIGRSQVSDGVARWIKIINNILNVVLIKLKWY